MIKSKKGIIPYIAITIIGIFVIIYSVTLSASAKTEYNPNLEVGRDGLLWEKSPETMSKSWESEKEYNKLINTPGSMVAVDDHGVYRLNSENGDVIWSYVRKNATICLSLIHI